MNGSIILFEDHLLDDMRPITLTRPAFGVTVAVYTLYEVARLVTANVRCIVRDNLKKTVARAYPVAPPQEGPTLFLNASTLPDVRYAEKLTTFLEHGHPFLATVGQRVAAALVPPATPLPAALTANKVTGWLLGLNLPLTDDGLLATLDCPFHIVKWQADIFAANIQRKLAEGRFHQVADGVFTGENVQIAKTAVFDASAGPIILDNEAQILDFTYFRGPLYIGPHTRVNERSSVKDRVSIGHTCKIGGEVESSTIESHTNKSHHGFLGHSYVGSWVNLDAGTSVGDLNSTYGDVRIEAHGRRIDTGMQFFGCAIADYAKSAINTSIFPGQHVGVSSMLYGYVGQNVPSFTHYARSFGQVREVTLEQAIIAQKRMFARRHVEQTEDDIALLSSVFELTREDRIISSEIPVL